MTENTDGQSIGIQQLREPTSGVTPQGEKEQGDMLLGTAASGNQTDPPSTPNGVALIAAERQRQIDVEGWTPAHDDAYENAELVSAAICYANAGSGFALDGVNEAALWPWAEVWMRADRATSAGCLRSLIKAGALIAAEIDRIQRSSFRR